MAKPCGAGAVGRLVVKYRGYTIEVERTESLGGWETLYYSVFYRNRECLSSFEDSTETLDAKVQQLKDRIDGELATKDPWGRKASS